MSQEPEKSIHDILAERISLEGNVRALTDLRDQLALALATLEQNTARISAWLSEKTQDITVARHRLNRMMRKEPMEALEILKSIDKEMLGFLLTDETILSVARETFGAASPIVRKLAAHHRGLPARLIEALPVIDLSDEMGTRIAKTVRDVAAPKPEAARPPEKKGGMLSNWFQSKASRDAEEEEQAYRAMVGQWRQLHRELLDLQSDKHYFVDSFMDWVGENLAPSDPLQDFAAIMTRYQHPGYVLDLAQRDYDEVHKARSEAVLEGAKTYGTVASLLDAQKISDFIAEIPNLFPRPDTTTASTLRQLLLTDFASGSMAELALNHVAKPADRLDLFKAALAFDSNPVLLNGTKTYIRVFKSVLDAVTQETSPLPPAVLTEILRKFNLSLSERSALLEQSGAFGRLTERFGDKDGQLQDALGSLLDSSSAAHSALHGFVGLRRALLNNAYNETAAILASIRGASKGRNVRALWDLCMPGVSLTDRLRQVSQDDAVALMPLLSDALPLGLVPELCAATDNGQLLRGGYDEVDSLVRDVLLPGIEKIPAASVSMLLAGTNVGAVQKEWRASLEGSNGHIAAVLGNAKINDAQKLGYIAALLSPVASPRGKAAVLTRIAETVKDAQSRALLRDAAYALEGDVMPMGNDTFLVNPASIANIWYETKSKTSGDLCYTTGGAGHVLAQQVSRDDAEDLFTLLDARHSLAREENGLFSMALIDSAEHTIDTARPENSTTAVGWNGRQAAVKIGADLREELMALPEFIHARGKPARLDTQKIVSFRPHNLLAIIPVPDQGNVSKIQKQWLLIDGAGGGQLVTSLELPKEMGALLPIGQAYINPAMASMLNLDNDSKALDFRSETLFFRNLVSSLRQHATLADLVTDNDLYLRLKAGDAGQWATLRKHIEGMGAAALAPGGSLKDLRFNLQLLGFITTRTTFAGCEVEHSRRESADVVNSRKNITADSPEEAVTRGRDLMNGLMKAADAVGAIVIGRNGDPLNAHIVDTDQIQNIYYSDKEGILTILTEHDRLPFSLGAREAKEILRGLAAKPEWTAVDKKVGTQDLIRYDRASKLYVTRTQEGEVGMAQIGGGEKPVQLGLPKSSFLRLTEDLVENERRNAVATADKKALADFTTSCLRVPLMPHMPLDILGKNPAQLIETLLQSELAAAVQATKKSFTAGAKRNSWS